MHWSILLLSLLLSQTQAFNFDIHVENQWANNEAHSELLVTASFYNDNSRFVTGSSDNKVKIWSMDNFTLLHEEVFSDDVTHVSLHPYDNRIFVLTYDGNINVMDPENYNILHSDTYPSGTGNGNYIRFFDSGDKYIMSGYDGASSPDYYIFYDSNYSLVSSANTSTGFSACTYIAKCR